MAALDEQHWDLIRLTEYDVQIEPASLWSRLECERAIVLRAPQQRCLRLVTFGFGSRCG